MKKFIIKFSLFIFIGIITLYLCFLFLLPEILSSDLFKSKIYNFLYDRTGIKITSKNIKVKTYPNLYINFSADKFRVDNKNSELLNAKNAVIVLDLKSFSLKKLNVDYVFVNEEGISEIVNKKDTGSKSNYKFTKLPEVLIKKAEIWIDRDNSHSAFITIDNLRQINKNGRTKFTFNSEIVSDILKNTLVMGQNGYLYYENGSLYAENFQILIGTSALYLNGKITDYKHENINLNIQGKDIPIDGILASLLYFQKIKSHGKKFIENFYDYSGSADVNLTIDNNGLWGKFSAKDLAGSSVLFKVPIKFPHVDFIFNGGEITANSKGLFGGEPVYSDFIVSDIAQPNQIIKGSVKSKLTNKFADKYIPDFNIKGNANAGVNYTIQNKKITITYQLKIPKGSDLYYKNAYLGLENVDRRLFVKTLKENDKLTITDYDYSSQENNKITKIIKGDGLFLKENGHLTPQYLTFKTQNDAPVSVIGSFHKYVDGGVFYGDLKYDFKNNLITGIFDIKNSKYKDFDITNAKVNANSKNVIIEAMGKYKDSPFKCYLNGLNRFDDNIKIYNMDLFLDKYTVKKNANPSTINIKIPEKVKDINVDIDKWTIKVNKIIRKRMVISDILVSGSIHNKIFNFKVPNISFAKGNISGKGVYNYRNKSSNVSINAENIDSGVVADVIFELPGQIEGIANASLTANTHNGFDDVKASVDFSVENGFLPKLGSTEFMIKKSKLVKRPFKVKVSDIVNIDVKNMKALSSNLKGHFSLDNQKIENAKICSSQKYLALLIEGNYDIDNEQADLSIFGKYNQDKISRVKILFVPLSFILKVVLRAENPTNEYQTKLSEVPAININENEKESAFRVKIDGNINNNDVKVQMKRIK